MSFFAKTLEFINEAKEVAGRSTLAKTAHIYYDFTQLTGANGAAISNGNVGLNDLSGNGHHATIVGTPVVRDLTVSAEVIKTLQDSSTNCVNTGVTGATFMGADFDIYFVLQSADGLPDAATMSICGGIHPTNIGPNVYLDTSGFLGINFGTTSGVLNYRTTSAVWGNGVTNPALFRIRFSYTNTNIEIYKNGVLLTAGYVSGSFASITGSQVATDFTTNIYIGALNNNGTPTSNPNTSSFLKFAIVTGQASTGAATNQTSEALMDFSWADWESKEIHITSGNAATLRSDFIADIFNGGSLPTLSPTVTSSHTGAIHICNTAQLTGFSSVDKLSFSKNDVDGFAWTNICYLIFASSPNGKLFINNLGHASDSVAQHEAMMNRALSYGYDVLFTSMPVVGDNVEANPTITSTSSGAHNQMLSGGLDRVGYCPVELFFFDKFSAINYLNANYSSIVCAGNSGGGWAACIMGALDERIDSTFIIRGAKLRSFKFAETSSDYEQGGMPSYIWTDAILGTILPGTRLYQFYSDVTYYDLMALGATSGREVWNLSHQLDTCCFGGTVGWVWMDSLKSIAGQLGGSYHHIIDFKPGTATHQYSYYDINNVFHALGDT